MDAFVRENDDGTFTLDSLSLQAELKKFQLSTVDHEIIFELTSGIILVNEKIISSKQQNVDLVLGAACWYYWWGKRCCYWGSDAHYYVMVMAMGGTVPGIGWGLAIYAAWAEYFVATRGGFCFNQSWAGGVWLTAP